MTETTKSGIKTVLSWANSFGSSTVSSFLVATVVPPQVWLPLKGCAYLTGFVASWMYDEKADEFIDRKVDELADLATSAKEIIEEAASENKIEVVK